MILKDLENRALPPLLSKGMTAEDWPARRHELMALLAREEYGISPAPPAWVKAETVACESRAWAGKAEHKELALRFPTPKGDFSFQLDTVIPNSEQPLPLIIYISFLKYPNGKYGPIEEIVDNGYALASFCYQDVTADEDDGFSSGLAGMFERPDGDRSQWGKIAMWAWAASRVMDYALTLDAIDNRRIVCAGHSRLGKTALWCGARDERFAAAVSNDSGCSGAAISRGKGGESIRAITKRFPHWFCETYRDYADREDALPFDQHALVSMLAPRPVYVASAQEDLWADPHSEFLSCAAADEVYRLLGLTGLVHQNRYPRAGEWLHEGNIGYHLRPGTHFMSRYDWQMLMRYMDKHLPV